ncbi:MAG: hypothetical protein Q8L53_07760 [Aestuariivirga sp.]|nr:hypothetical protein [Aestuariivirga sp.]
MGSNIGSAASSKQANEIKDILLETQTAAFGHAQTYTTVVIFGGYAGLFGIWSFTRESLSEGTNVWVGLLIGISMLTFVSFEIFKMIVHTREHIKVRNLLLAQLTPAQFLSKHASLVKENNLTIQRVVIPVWVAALIISAGTGVGAAIILLSCFSAAVV